MTELLIKAFDYELSEAEEALLDRLEQEWLTTCRANQLEDFDFWTTPKSYKAEEAR